MMVYPILVLYYMPLLCIGCIVIFQQIVGKPFAGFVPVCVHGLADGHTTGMVT